MKASECEEGKENGKEGIWVKVGVLFFVLQTAVKKKEDLLLQLFSSFSSSDS